jgi:hypothetical protein
MRMEGLEPSRPEGHGLLKPARLPIPSHPRDVIFTLAPVLALDAYLRYKSLNALTAMDADSVAVGAVLDTDQVAGARKQGSDVGQELDPEGVAIRDPVACP